MSVEKMTREQLTPVRWADASGGEWDGYASGVTWNGWDEIYVTEETREVLRLAWFIPESQCCAHPRAVHVEGNKDGQWFETCNGAVPAPYTDLEGRESSHSHTCPCTGYEDGASNVTLCPTVEIDGRTLVYLAGFCTSIVSSNHESVTRERMEVL